MFKSNAFVHHLHSFATASACHGASLTSVSGQILRGNHDNETDGLLIPEHFKCPPSDGPHALHCSDAIISNKDLGKLKVVS